MPPSTLQTSSSTLSTGSATGSKMDPSDQKEIDAIWKEVHSKVIELAGGDPKKAEKMLDINSVLGYIDQVHNQDKKKAEKFGTFKMIVSRTLQCINHVGGIVASGVSSVFAPAGMCYNALTFVIQAWQGYEGMFANLGELLEKCVEFLERLESYEGRMDARLTRLACQNLRLFVEICDRMIKMRKKHNRLFAFTKQLFLNDDGIQGLLGMMERLNSKESLLVSAQTYRIVSDSADGIKMILDGQKEQKKDDDAKKWRRSIAKKLGFPGTTLDPDGDPLPTWRRPFDTRRNALVPDTGKWLWKDSDFLSWAQWGFPPKSLLVVEGRNGSGKTSLMANAVRSIRKMEQVRPTSRIVTAYYFAEGDKRKGDDAEGGSMLETASRILLWQIATAYEAMTKSMAQLVERAEFDDTLDTWQQLFNKNKERRNPDTTWYIFIDNIQPDLIPLLEMLSQSSDGKVRVFATARQQISMDYIKSNGSLDYTTIPIGERNADDIDKYITDRLDNISIFKDPSRPGITEWRETVRETLRFKCAGDFFKLNISLNALSKVDLIEDIKLVLDEADRTRTDQIDAELRHLNSIRTIKEIEEINEIMLWINSGRSWFDVASMEALLSVKHRGTSILSDAVNRTTLTRRKTGSPTLDSIAPGAAEPRTMTISLLPFAQKLAEKYPIFAITDSGYVDWRSSEIVDRVPKKGLERDALFNTSQSGPQIIQESEISIVRHFLNNVCPPDLYQRFDFEHFFDAKIGAKHKEFIALDPDNAEIKISIACLVILVQEDLRAIEELRQYAMYWFLDHLKHVDLSAADRELKAQVGPLLVKLLTEDCGIDSMFWPFDLNISAQRWSKGEYGYLHKSRAEWVYSMAGVQEISRWFHDSSVTRLIVGEPGESLVRAVKSPTGNLHEAVLSIAAKHMATHLFRTIEFLPRQFQSACFFIRGYLSRLDPKRSSEMKEEPVAYENFESPLCQQFECPDFKLHEIKEIESWAVTTLQNENDNAVEQSGWEIHGALMTFQLSRKEEGSMEIYQPRARKALELNPRNWHASHFIAKQPNTSQEESIALLTRAKDALDKLKSENHLWLQDHSNSALLARITLDLGNFLWDRGNDRKVAAQLQRDSLQLDYVHWNQYAQHVLAKYHQHEAWNEFTAFFEALNSNSNNWAAYLEDLGDEFVKGWMGWDAIAQVADATERWDAIETFFTLAIDLAAKQQTAYDLVFILRDGFAKTLEASNNVDEAKIVPLRRAALEHIRANPSKSMVRQRVTEMADALAKTYLSQALMPGSSAEEVVSIGSSLEWLVQDIEGIRQNNVNILCCFIRYHQKNKTESGKLAQDWIHTIARAGIELLSDDDEENDDFAYWLLARLLTTLGDAENLRIVWTLRNMLQQQSLLEWQNWVATANTASFTSPNGSAEPRSDTKVPAQAQSSADKETAQEVASQTGSGTPPPEPSWFVGCDGCDTKAFVVMTEDLYTCADCVAVVQLCVDCHARLQKGELKAKNLKCKKEHEFFTIPKYDDALIDGMPKGYVPLPDSKDKTQRWIPLDTWKGRLRKLYIDGVDKGVLSPLSA
ncbi:hypothetical protein F4778DRAFT_548298 [Xylariomycetidae sp. FL2044]|nr:hypothetical protein F4778DRAFT_548298 [Xylariomycetidae sp. FL2044]